MTMVKKAIILVAGFGTRFLPATKAQPKEMLPIVDKPVIQYLVEETVASGIKDIIFVTGRGKRAIEDHFDHSAELEEILESRGKHKLAKEIRRISSLANFAFVRQKKALGTGDALLQVKHLIDKEPVAIVYGDDVVVSDPPCLKQLIAIYEKFQAPVLALERVPRKDVSRYGVIDGVKVGPRLFKINRLVEKPSAAKAPSNLIRIGKFIFTPEIFEMLAKTKPPRHGEFYDLIALDRYVREGGLLYGYEYIGQRYDCGDKLGLLKAVVDFGLRHAEVKSGLRAHLKRIVSNW